MCLGNPLGHRFARAESVHQETHRAAIDPKDWHHPVQIQHAVQYVQHEAIAAQHHQGVCLFRLHPTAFAGKNGGRLLRGFTIRGH